MQTQGRPREAALITAEVITQGVPGAAVTWDLTSLGTALKGAHRSFASANRAPRHASLPRLSPRPPLDKPLTHLTINEGAQKFHSNRGGGDRRGVASLPKTQQDQVRVSP